MRKAAQGRKVMRIPSKEEKLDALTLVLPPFIPRIGLLGWFEETDWLFCVINVTYLSRELSRTVLEKY